MADLKKIKDLDHRISRVWAEIRMILLQKKKHPPGSEQQRAESRELRQQLAHKNSELQQLEQERLSCEHCYNIILTGAYYDKSGGIIHDYPFNIELTALIDCRLGRSTTLSSDESSHAALHQMLQQRYASHFVNGSFEVAYVIQLR